MSLKLHRQLLKENVLDDKANPHDRALEDLQVICKVSEDSLALINGSEGRERSSNVISRLTAQMDPEIIDGLPRRCRFIGGSRFYNPQLNRSLKYNQVFFLEDERMIKFLLECTSFSFDATFPLGSKDKFSQLGIIVGRLSPKNNIRCDVIIPIFWSFMTEKSLPAYQDRD